MTKCRFSRSVYCSLSQHVVVVVFVVVIKAKEEVVAPVSPNGAQNHGKHLSNRNAQKGDVRHEEQQKHWIREQIRAWGSRRNRRILMRAPATRTKSCRLPTEQQKVALTASQLVWYALNEYYLGQHSSSILPSNVPMPRNIFFFIIIQSVYILGFYGMFSDVLFSV